MALIIEKEYGNGKINIWDDCAKKDPKEIEKTIDRVSEIVLNYYRRQTA